MLSIESSQIDDNFEENELADQADLLSTSIQDKTKCTLRFQDAKAQAITSFEKNYLENIMKLVNGNVSAAARLAGKERRALGKLLQKYKIPKSQFRAVSEQV